MEATLVLTVLVIRLDKSSFPALLFQDGYDGGESI